MDDRTKIDDAKKRGAQAVAAAVAHSEPGGQANLDLDALPESLAWTFTVTLGGRNYATRPPTFAEIERLNQLKTEGQHAIREPLETLADMREIALSLFVGDQRPALEGLDVLRVLRAAVLCVNDWNRRRLAAFGRGELR